MNFLAHIYLSGDSDELKIGNFVGDYVKGRDYEKYPLQIKNGIILHRNIDSYTDNHPVVKLSKAHFITRYHKFSGVIVDILYDHFLAKDWDRFSDQPLHEFLQDFHQLIIEHSDILPIGVKSILPFFILDNWVDTYLTIEGIEKIFILMSKNTSLPYENNYAVEVLKNNYEALRKEFYEFFPQIIKYVEEKNQIKIRGLH
ncbi:MAG: ACP phosphodiesterase [Bacteroidota bacterium]|nr:ACP phosphodiesterase [Bacteroidota bacterium]MDP4225517.1 ACP phosphodiesterase [Bacteroidota bacterium]MDP4273459.1 ACP phosphodiesterase [Bacteroidota bacterium]